MTIETPVVFIFVTQFRNVIDEFAGNRVRVTTCVRALHKPREIVPESQRALLRTWKTCAKIRIDLYIML